MFVLEMSGTIYLPLILFSDTVKEFLSKEKVGKVIPRGRWKKTSLENPYSNVKNSKVISDEKEISW